MGVKAAKGEAKGGVWFKATAETKTYLKERAEREHRSLSDMISIWMDMMANGAELSEPKKRRKSNG